MMTDPLAGLLHALATYERVATPGERAAVDQAEAYLRDWHDQIGAPLDDRHARAGIVLLANSRSYGPDDIRWAAAFARHVERR
jgi:hypothetical protein